MKVRSQINLLVAILIFAFGIANIGFVIANRIADQVDDLQLKTSIALQNVYRMTDINKELVLTSSPLDRKVEEWRSIRDDLSASLDEITTHPAVELLSDRAKELIEGSMSVWQLTISRFEITNSSFILLLENEDIPDAVKVGLNRLHDYLQRENKSPTLIYQVEQLNRELQVFDTTAEDMVVQNLTEVSAAVADQAARIRQLSHTLVLILAAIVIAGAILFVFFFGRALARRVGSIQSVMERVAQRDMTERTRSAGNDEIAGLGRDLDEALDALAGFIGEVRRAVDEADELKDGLSSGSAESASAINEISHNIDSIRNEFSRLDNGIDQSTSAVQDIDTRIRALNDNILRQSKVISTSTVSVEEMDSSIKQVAALSSERQKAAESLVQVILDGGEKINATNSIIDSVTAEVDDILEIIEIINAVAEQTNLLSMNAAIESAHAGEAGKGFAVVAEEIRKLAESTSDNAAQIDRLLKSITGKIRDAVAASRSGSETFETISRDVGLFKEAMDDINTNMQTLSRGSASIVETTQQLTEITGSVTESAETIATSTDQINSAMNDAANMSSSIADGMREIDTGAKEILTAITDISRLSDENRERMHHLSILVSEFKTQSDGPATLPTGVTEAE